MKRSPLLRKSPLKRVPFRRKTSGEWRRSSFDSSRSRKRRRRNPPRTIARSEKYKRFIRKQPCLIANGCSHEPVEAAHTGPHGIGIKASDLDCIPLCAYHHRRGTLSYHNLGEKRFLEHWGIDLEVEIARLRGRFLG